MTAPIVTFEDNTDTQMNDSNPCNLGSINAGTESDVKEIRIYNNKGGASSVSDMENVTITAVTATGLTSGDTVSNGSEAVSGKWLNVESVTLGESSFTAVGGTTVKNLGTICGGVLAAPGTPTGAKGTVTGGAVAAGTYYYKVSAMDETGETLPGTESAAVTVDSSNNKVDLTWTAVAGATSYKVYRTTTSGTYTTPALVGTATTNSFTDTLAIPTAGAPLATATVTYQHKHVVDAKIVVPTNATGGAVTMGTRVAYSYS